MLCPKLEGKAGRLTIKDPRVQVLVEVILTWKNNFNKLTPKRQNVIHQSYFVSMIWSPKSVEEQCLVIPVD